MSEGLLRYTGKRTELVQVTPEYAAQLLEAVYDRQRKPDQDWVNYLAECMRKREFKTDTIEIHVWDDNKFVTDGQHRLLAVQKYGQPVEMNLLWFYTDDPATIDQAYARTQAGKNRSMRDKMLALRGKAQGNLTAREEAVVGGAALILLDGFQSANLNHSLTRYEMSPANRVRGMEHWRKEGHLYFRTVGYKEPLLRVFPTNVVCALALVTFRHQEEKATEFWRTLSENHMLERGSPLWRMSNLLLQGRRDQGINEYARRMAICWNAWYRGSKNVGHVTVRNEVSPIIIEGTPHRGNAVIRYTYEEGAQG